MNGFITPPPNKTAKISKEKQLKKQQQRPEIGSGDNDMDREEQISTLTNVDVAISSTSMYPYFFNSEKGVDTTSGNNNRQ